MDSRTFLGLEPTHNPFRWKLPVTEGISTTGNFLFGGSGLGAAISAMEGTSGRQCVWATAQYLSYAKPGEVVDIDVTIAVDGHQLTQARAVCHVADREILTVNAALGDRDIEASGQWEHMPADVPPPLECRERPHFAEMAGTINDRLEERMVKARPYEDLDGSVPANWTASSGTLSISPHHYKLGAESLRWDWNSGSVITVDTPGIPSADVVDF